AIDRFRLALPIAGDIWLKYQVAIFSRTLSTLLSGGLPLVQALETAGSSVESKLVSNAVLQSVQKVREGRPLSRSLEETGIFPELSFEMIEVGESTGALPAMLTSVAEFLEEDVQTALSAALSLIEPVILVVMGVVVATMLIGLYLPILSLRAQDGGAFFYMADTAFFGGSPGANSESRGGDLARRYRPEFVDLKNYNIQHELFRTVPVDLMFRYNFVPLEEKGDELTIAISDPSRLMMIDEVSLLLNKRVQTKVATLAQIEEILKKT